MKIKKGSDDYIGKEDVTTRDIVVDEREAGRPLYAKVRCELCKLHTWYNPTEDDKG